MGFFRKAAAEQPPTAIDLAAPDAEKGSIEYGDVTGSPDRVQHHIDPAMEKNVVRKLDRNLVTLVTVLCKTIQLDTEQRH